MYIVKKQRVLEKMLKYKLVPPDGAWGWMIMVSYTLSNIIFIPIQQNFGLLFKDKFKSFGLFGSNVTSIISTNLALEFLVGLATGPLIKRFKIRKVSFAGSILFCLGIASTIFAKTYLQFLVGYGIIGGIGAGIIRLTSNLSLNLYFLKRRNKVAGVTLGLRSLGSIIMPHVVVWLVSTCGIKSTLLYLLGLSLHLLCASLLLQPVEWHLKRVINEELTDVSVHLLDDQKPGTIKKSLLKKLESMYDLKLFKNTSFLVISIGMMCSIFADINFSSLFALVLTDLNFSNQQAATFISICYISSVIVVVLCPFVGDFFKKSPRFMYFTAVFLAVIGRFVIIYLANPEDVPVLPILWGGAMGIRNAYLGVVLADNVPPQSLASAESNQMFITGVLVLFGGSLLGIVKDVAGSYVSCVYVLNVFSCLTLLLWTFETVYKNIHKKYKDVIKEKTYKLTC